MDIIWWGAGRGWSVNSFDQRKKASFICRQHWDYIYITYEGAAAKQIQCARAIDWGGRKNVMIQMGAQRRYAVYIWIVDRCQKLYRESG